MLKFASQITLAICFAVSINAQNLIDNGSFETRTGCPPEISPGNQDYTALAPPWKKHFGTTDYFHSCATPPPTVFLSASVPNNFNGNQPAQDGDGYMGAITYTFAGAVGNEKEKGEYFYQQLPLALQAGKTYQLEFYTSIAEQSGWALDNIGATFSNQRLNRTTWYHTTPGQVMNTPGQHIDDPTVWTKICGSFVANGGEQFITVGAFGSNVVYKDVPQASVPRAYYYFDNFTLIELPELDLEDGLSTCQPITLDTKIPGATYSWSTGETTQAISIADPGTYWVDVTIGCTTITDTVIISGGSGNVNVSLGPDTSICSSNSYQLDATIVGASYEWHDQSTNPTFTATASGIYWVNVTKDGCTGTDSVTVTFGDLDFNIDVTNSSTCDRFGSVTATGSITGITGTPPYSYNWSIDPNHNHDTISGLIEGTHQVSVSDSKGCTTTKSFDVVHFIQLSVNKTDPSCISCADGDATVTVGGTGIPPFTYRWDDENEQTTATATGLGIGSYTVTVTDSAGCFTQIEVTLGSVGIGHNDIRDVNIYPNPASNFLFIEGKDLMRVELYDLTGRMILFQENSFPSFSKVLLDKVNSSGLYFVVVRGKDYSLTRNIIITR